MGKNQFEFLFPAAAAAEKKVSACQNEPPLAFGSRCGLPQYRQVFGNGGPYWI
jgi:hypothetical protein